MSIGVNYQKDLTNSQSLRPGMPLWKKTAIMQDILDSQLYLYLIR